MAELDEELPDGGINEAVDVYSFGIMKRTIIVTTAVLIAIRKIFFLPRQTVRRRRAASIEFSELASSNSF